MVTVMTIFDRFQWKNGLAAAGLAPVFFGLLMAGAPGTTIVAVAATGPVADLAPHQASYRMTLKSARNGSGVVDAQGAALYRFAETCESWAMENNIYLKIGYVGGPTVKIAWSFAAVESKNGRNYRFRLRHKRDGETVELLQGAATLDAMGGSGRALFKFTKNPSGPDKADAPTDVTMDLPEGTLFPTQHFMAVLKAGRDGTRFLTRVVFDGSSLNNPYNVTATISGAETAAIGQPVKAMALAAGLRDMPAQAVRLVFFPVRSRKPEPEFEVGVDYRADGLATKVIHDYGDYSIDMTPTEIELLARPEC
jgi:hypothetical protein